MFSRHDMYSRRPAPHSIFLLVCTCMHVYVCVHLHAFICVHVRMGKCTHVLLVVSVFVPCLCLFQCPRLCLCLRPCQGLWVSVYLCCPYEPCMSDLYSRTHISEYINNRFLLPDANAYMSGRRAYLLPANLQSPSCWFASPAKGNPAPVRLRSW